MDGTNYWSRYSVYIACRLQHEVVLRQMCKQWHPPICVWYAFFTGLYSLPVVVAPSFASKQTKPLLVWRRPTDDARGTCS